MPRSFKKAAVASSDSQVLRPLTSRRMADCGTPRPASQSADASASVYTSPGSRPPVTTIERGQAPLPQVEGVAQPGGQVGRRDAVVLGGAEHDDGLDRAGLVLSRRPPHQAQVEGQVQDGGTGDNRDDTQQPASPRQRRAQPLRPR